MKALVLFFLVFLHSMSAYGDGVLTSPRSHKRFKINASTNNIPAAFDTTAGSLVITGIGNAQHIMICSEIGSRIAFNFRQGSETSAPTTINGYIPAAPASSYACVAMDDVQLSSTLYLQSDTGGAISTNAVVYGWVW